MEPVKQDKETEKKEVSLNEAQENKDYECGYARIVAVIFNIKHFTNSISNQIFNFNVNNSNY